MKTKTNFCLAKKRRGVDGKTLRNDERAVSAVIGVILMIAITVVIAAVVAAFAYGIIGGVATAPNSALVIEDATEGKWNITILHHGGDAISGAFIKTNNNNASEAWDEIEVRINGARCEANNSIWLNGGNVSETKFKSGYELKIKVDEANNLDRVLASGDTIAVIYTPSGDLLQRVKVA